MAGDATSEGCAVPEEIDSYRPETHSDIGEIDPDNPETASDTVETTSHNPSITGVDPASRAFTTHYTKNNPARVAILTAAIAALLDDLRDLDDLVLQFGGSEAGDRFIQAWKKARIIVDASHGPGEEDDEDPAPPPPAPPAP